MRLGIYGGTFDPIHYGHLLLAEQCREQCELDEVWFVPAARPPHKLDSTISPEKSRCDMIEFAIAGHPSFRVSQIELQRTGPSFTVATLEQLHAEDRSRDLFLLIGADSLRDLPLWRDPQRILQLSTVVAANRGDQAPPDRSVIEDQLGLAALERIRFISMPGLDLSSSDIRARRTAGRSIRYLVPRAVEAYVIQNGLYAHS